MGEAPEQVRGHVLIYFLSLFVWPRSDRRPVVAAGTGAGTRFPFSFFFDYYVTLLPYRRPPVAGNLRGRRNGLRNGNLLANCSTP